MKVKTIFLILLLLCLNGTNLKAEQLANTCESSEEMLVIIEEQVSILKSQLGLTENSASKNTVIFVQISSLLGFKEHIRHWIVVNNCPVGT